MTKALSEQAAHEIGVEAYTYLHPLITMDITRKQLTNVAMPQGITGPMNMFVNVAAFPLADMSSGATEPQMNPDAADFQAFLATARARYNMLNFVEVTTGYHAFSLTVFVAFIAWIWAATAAPSPTAAATRLVDPARTSPIANIPGWPVSNGNGRPPVSTDPFSSVSIQSTISSPAQSRVRLEMPSKIPRHFQIW